jgi:hypothetical protein
MNTEQAIAQLAKAGLIPSSDPIPAAATIRAIWPRPRFQRRNITPILLRGEGLLKHAPAMVIPPRLTCIPRVLSTFA